MQQFDFFSLFVFYLSVFLSCEFTDNSCVYAYGDGQFVFHWYFSILIQVLFLPISICILHGEKHASCYVRTSICVKITFVAALLDFKCSLFEMSFRLLHKLDKEDISYFKLIIIIPKHFSTGRGGRRQMKILHFNIIRRKFTFMSILKFTIVRLHEFQPSKGEGLK